MPTLVLDLVQGAELTGTMEQVTYLRSGYVDNIDLADTPDPDALVKVLEFLTAQGHPMGSPLGPNSQNMRLARVRIKSSDAKFRRVNLELAYETSIINMTPTAYMLRDRTFSIQKNTCFIPGTRIPIVVGYSPTANNGDGANIAPEPVFMNLSVSARSLGVTVLMYGRPTGGTADYVNHVNNAPWPNGGMQVFNGQTLPSATAKPVGYWRLSSYASEYNQQGMTLIQSEAITQITEDWSEVGMMRHEKTGRYPFAGLDAGTRLSVITAMNAPTYSYGTIYPTTAAAGFTWPIQHGVTRVGPHPMTDFQALFGFILPLMFVMSLVFSL